MKVLALLSDRAHPATNIVRTRNYYLWPALKKLGVSIRVLGMDREPKSPFSPEPPQVESEFLAHESSDQLLDKVKSVLLHDQVRNKSEKLAKRINKIITDWHPEIIHAEGLEMARYLPCMNGQKIHCRQTVTFHRMESEHTMLEKNDLPPFLFKPAAKLYQKELAALEEKVAKKVDLGFTLTKRELNYMFHKYNAGAWTLSSHGVDAAVENAHPQLNDYSILVCCRLNYGPELEGFNWFIDEVFHQLTPNIKISVLATHMDAELRARVRMKKIKLVERLADKSQVYPDSAICVAPYTYGSELPARILDPMAYGRAVVTTKTARDALGLETGQGILVADEAHKFAKKVSLLLENFNERKHLAETGLMLARKKYDWPVIAKQMIRDWDGLLHGRYLK